MQQVLDQFRRAVVEAKSDGVSNYVRFEGKRGYLKVCSETDRVNIGDEQCPLVVFDEKENQWIVLPVRHLLELCRKYSTGRDALEIYLFDLWAISPAYRVQDNKKLQEMCIQALEDAQDPLLRMTLKSIQAATKAVTNALIDTYLSEV